MKDILNLFSGKRVMITGHTGFKGSWLTFLLNELGSEIMGYGLPPTQEMNHFDLLKIRNNILHIEGDICDLKKLDMHMNTFKPEFVIHLAAQALVKKSYMEPADTFKTNLMGSVNILESVKNCDSVRSLVFITSDKCYENLEWIWGYRESDQIGGRDPYSASKGAAEIIFSSYLRSFFEERPLLGAASTRAGNVIGGGDWSEDRIIPDCIRAIEAKKPIVLRHPNATRPWQHVLEPLAGYLLLAGKLYEDPKKWSGSWNFGPSTKETRTVKEVAEVVIGHLGEGTIKIDEPNDNEQVHEANLLQLNCDKAQQLLKWYPRWTVEETLEATALWYKDIMEGRDAKQVTGQQIRNYFPELR